MDFSRRLPADLSPSPLAVELSQIRDAVDLTAANPTLAGLAVPDLAMRLAADNAGLYHPDPRGLLSARRAVVDYAAFVGLALATDRLLITASTSEAYGLLLKLLCNPGDKIAAPSPSYPLVDVLAGLELVEVVRYELTCADRWRVDVESVAAALHAGARAVIVVQPNNPTGSCASPQEIVALDELCAAHDAAIISDEVFRVFPMGPVPLMSLAGERLSLTFVLDGLSKSAALPQLKLGWLAAFGPSARVAAAMSRLEWISDAYLSVATPVQLALPALLEGAPKMQRQICERVRLNREVLAGALGLVPAVELLTAEGGWYAVLRVPAVGSEDELVLRLAHDARVIVHPGYFYDFAHDGYLVLGLIAPPQVFEVAVRRLARVLAEICG